MTKEFILSVGADISNILNFEKDFPGTEIIKLEQNYRCTGNILKAANAVIKHNTVKYEKKLWTENDEGHIPEIYSGQQRRQRIYLSGIRHGTIVRRRNREKNRRTDQCDRVQGTTPASHGKRIHPAPGSRPPGISAGVSEQGAFPE